MPEKLFIQEGLHTRAGVYHAATARPQCRGGKWTDKQRHRQTCSKICRAIDTHHTDIQPDRDTSTQADRHTRRQTEKEQERQRDRQT